MIDIGSAPSLPTPPPLPPPFGIGLNQKSIRPDASPWREAQACLAVPLASAAARFGAMGERLRSGGPGRQLRLALIETAALSLMAGDRVAADRLAIECRRTEEGGQTDGPMERGLAVLRWLTEGSAACDGPTDAAEVIPGLHPIAAAAALFASRQQAARQGDARGFLQAAAAAALAGVTGAPGGATFLPQAMGGSLGLMAGGDVEDRLSRWIAGVEAAAAVGLAELDRLDRWQRRAEAAALDYSGRTPARLLAVLEEWPVVTAPLAEQASGASRAAVQRNLDRLCDTGLIREITGRGRYRMWTAVL